MKKRIILLFILCIMILTGCNKQSQNKKENTTEDYVANYVAYVKINPSIKLNYSLKCTRIDGYINDCEAPIVNSYELVNDDAKSIYKDIDLLSESKDLSDVIKKICTIAKNNGIDVKNVEVQSDWDMIDNYIQSNNTNGNDDQTTIQNEEINFNVDIKKDEEIVNNIQNDVQEEIKIKEEAEKKAQEEAEAKAKAEAEKAAKEEAETIKLADNVYYSHSGVAYCCEGCFSSALIKTLKNAKGYSVTYADSDRIDIKYITKLTPDKYNTATFKGSSMISKIKNAGGEECGGLGGEAEPLTTSICKEYHLKCK